MAVRTSDVPATTHCSAAALPSEIVQMVFRNLSLFDLIRCQRVCKTWTACLPGNDPRLRESLFLQTTAADNAIQSITKIETYHDYSSRLNDRCRKIGFDWQFVFRLSELPTNGRSIILHPILADIGNFVHLIHPAINGIYRDYEEDDYYEDFSEFTAKYAHNHWWNACSFRSSDKLSQGTTQSWESMSIARPAVQQLAFEIGREAWSHMPTIMTIHAAEEMVGVTLGQFMQVLRDNVEAVQSKLADAPGEESSSR